MAEHRPFPPSARRLALARRAGLHAASPLATGAVAATAALLTAAALAGSAAARLGDSIAAACSGAGAPVAAAAAQHGELAAAAAAAASHSELAATAAASLAGAPRTILSLALPLLAAAAVAAAISQIAQARALWLPRRRIAGAPDLERGAAERTRRAGFELAAAALVGATALGWLWSVAPRLAILPSLPLELRLPGSALAAAAALIAGAAATLATGWALLGVLDAVLRHAGLAQALRMSAHDKREDDRLAGLDPRWRAYRAKTRRAAAPPASLAGTTLLLLGDGAAVAIAWDAARRPIPTRIAIGRAARATQLLGLARRDRVPVHRDPALAAALVASDGPVPEPHWPRLAEIIAAVRRS